MSMEYVATKESKLRVTFGVHVFVFLLCLFSRTTGIGFRFVTGLPCHKVNFKGRKKNKQPTLDSSTKEHAQVL